MLAYFFCVCYNKFIKVIRSINMLTIKQVADELNVCRMTIMRHLTKGNIKGIRVGRSWRISREEVERIKREGF